MDNVCKRSHNKIQYVKVSKGRKKMQEQRNAKGKLMVSLNLFAKKKDI
jgi:hypothetical protein